MRYWSRIINEAAKAAAAASKPKRDGWKQ